MTVGLYNSVPIVKEDNCQVFEYEGADSLENAIIQISEKRKTASTIQAQDYVTMIKESFNPSTNKYSAKILIKQSFILDGKYINVKFTNGTLRFYNATADNDCYGALYDFYNALNNINLSDSPRELIQQIQYFISYGSPTGSAFMNQISTAVNIDNADIYVTTRTTTEPPSGDDDPYFLPDSWYIGYGNWQAGFAVFPDNTITWKDTKKGKVVLYKPYYNNDGPPEYKLTADNHAYWLEDKLGSDIQDFYIDENYQPVSFIYLFGKIQGYLKQMENDKKILFDGGQTGVSYYSEDYTPDIRKWGLDSVRRGGSAFMENIGTILKTSPYHNQYICYYQVVSPTFTATLKRQKRSLMDGHETPFTTYFEIYDEDGNLEDEYEVEEYNWGNNVETENDDEYDTKTIRKGDTIRGDFYRFRNRTYISFKDCYKEKWSDIPSETILEYPFAPMDELRVIKLPFNTKTKTFSNFDEKVPELFDEKSVLDRYTIDMRPDNTSVGTLEVKETIYEMNKYFASSGEWVRSGSTVNVYQWTLPEEGTYKYGEFFSSEITFFPKESKHDEHPF